MTRVAAPTVGKALDDAVPRLREAGVADPRRDASSLMAIVLGTDRGGVVARACDPLDPAAARHFSDLVAKRAERAPMQYLEGVTEFRGLTIAVGPAVLIPRPETEDLVTAVLAAGLRDAAHVVDLGTGSGCIAIALAAVRPHWKVVAVDRSPGALALAADNAGRNAVSRRIEFVEADFASPPAAWRGSFDAVIANPPYVAEDEWRELAPEVRDHEPKHALVPGPTGIEAYAVLVPAAAELLAAGGLLALELGWKSEAAVRALAASHGFTRIEVRPDDRGIARVLTARRSLRP